MLGKPSRPVTIGKLSGALRSSRIMDSSTSPRSPLDCKMHYPRSPKHYDQQAGIGLAIVVALNNTSNQNYGGEILAKYGLSGQFSYCANPIPMIHSSLNNMNADNCYEAVDDTWEDEFTYVTCHGRNKSLTTKVYHDGYERGRVIASGINQNLGIFDISSPSMLFDDHCSRSDSDFLNSCQLCRKTLHGKDVYMYR